MESEGDKGDNVTPVAVTEHWYYYDTFAAPASKDINSCTKVDVSGSAVEDHEIDKADTDDSHIGIIEATAFVIITS